MRLFRRRRDLDLGSLPIGARVVDGPPLPEETRYRRETFRDARFDPPTRWIVFEGCRLERVDFSDLRFVALQLFDCRVEECDFARVRVGMSPFSHGSRFVECRFDGADLSGFGSGGRFERCSFDGTNLDEWMTFRCDFVECRFAGAIGDVVFWGKDAEGKHRNEFHGNDFRAADLRNVGFHGGIDLSRQLLPEGEAFVRVDRARQRIERALTEVEAWPEDEREAARHVLVTLLRPGDEQDELIIRRDAYVDYWDQADVDRTLDLLRDR